MNAIEVDAELQRLEEAYDALDGIKVCIAYGATEQSIVEDLKKAGLVTDKTKILPADEP